MAPKTPDSKPNGGEVKLQQRERLWNPCEFIYEEALLLLHQRLVMLRASTALPFSMEEGGVQIDFTAVLKCRAMLSPKDETLSRKY